MYITFRKLIRFPRARQNKYVARAWVLGGISKETYNQSAVWKELKSVNDL